MEHFLTKESSGDILELLIDSKIFAKDIVLKAAFNFLDRGYFFFKFDENENIILQMTKRKDNSEKLENIIEEFSDSLLETYLRDKLEKENKKIRETIIEKAINGPFDSQNFVTLDVENKGDSTQINFDKDINEILDEIENDPDLKIDEQEIETILKEIEDANQKPDISITPEAVKNFKKNIKK